MEPQPGPNRWNRSGHERRAAACLLAVGLCWPLLAGEVGGQQAEPKAGPSTWPGAAYFPHSYHSDDLGLDCADCHHETSAAALRTPHPDYFDDFWIQCESCHRRGDEIEEPESCGNCHTNGSEIGDETLSAKVVIHRSCWACHEVGTGQEASRGCGFCHEVQS